MNAEARSGYQRRALPRLSKPWKEPRTQMGRASQARSLKAFYDSLQDAFIRGTNRADLLINYFLKNIHRIDLRNPDLERYNPIREVLSRVYFKGVVKKDALQAACLYGVVVSLQNIAQTEEWSPLLSRLFNRVILYLRIGVQHALTRAWIRLPKNLRNILEYSWHHKQPYHDQMEAWMQLCVGSVRVATVALAFLHLAGKWRAYLPTIEEDYRRKLDLIVTGMAHIESTSAGLSKAGLALQVKGRRHRELLNSMHIVSVESNPVPEVIPDDEWTSLQSLWDLIDERYTGKRKFYPALAIVITPGDESPYDLERHSYTYSSAIQAAFRPT